MSGADDLATRHSCTCLNRVSTAVGCEVRMEHAESNSYNVSARHCIGRRSNSKAPRLGGSVVWMWYALVASCLFLTCLADDGMTTTEFPTTEFPTTPYSPKPPAFNLIDCKNSFDSVAQKIYICAGHPELFPILKYAEEVAKKACELDFQHELWNCSGFSLLRQPNISKADDVYKESAYVYALSVAAITHTVAKGCAQNIIHNCSCGVSSVSGKDTACSTNQDYGLGIADNFLNKRYADKGFSLKQQLAQHNFRAAKHIIHTVLNSTKKTCRCHGISGSCTFSTCHSELPLFDQLAKAIKHAYHNSCRVVPNGQSQNAWVTKCGRPVTERDLIHRKEGNWCLVKPSKGSLGVVGRECDPHPGAPNSCTKLCNSCGRGTRQFVATVQSQCECRFHFCCEINCAVCTEERTYFTCT